VKDESVLTAEMVKKLSDAARTYDESPKAPEDLAQVVRAFEAVNPARDVAAARTVALVLLSFGARPGVTPAFVLTLTPEVEESRVDQYLYDRLCRGGIVNDDLINGVMALVMSLTSATSSLPWDIGDFLRDAPAGSIVKAEYLS
jgi:hypothetical protein